MIYSLQQGLKPKPKSSLNLLSLSFWDVLDLNATFKTSMKVFKVSYNAQLPTIKGRIREGEYTTAKILVHLLCEEMEQMRIEQPKEYAFYMSDRIDVLPVSTNRGQLRTMMDQCYSLRTYSNIIARLLACGIIKRKLNTSRIKEEVITEKGHKKRVSRQAENGRGDFILFINKAALSFQYSMEESQQKGIIENEEVKDAVGKELQQPHSPLYNIKMNNHKCGNERKEGVAEPHQLDQAAVPAEIFFRRHDKNKAGERKAELTEEGKNHVAIFRKDHQISRGFSGGGGALEYYSTVLFYQLREQLYPHYKEKYIEQIAPHAKNLLRLHILRLSGEKKVAFQTVSRGIAMVNRYLKNHEKAYLYDMLTWLRVDGEYKSGTLKVVVDTWIPKEQERLRGGQKQMTTLVRWQYAHVFAEKLFGEFTKAFQSSFSGGVEVYKRAFKRLDYYFDKYELPPSTRKTIRRQFADRVYSILNYANRQANIGC